MCKKSFLPSILFGLLVLTFLVSCDKDFNEIGSDIVGDDHFGFQKYTGAFIKSYNQKLGPIASNNLAVNPLGFYDNPPFGSTRANFVTQVEMSVSDPRFNNVDPENYDVLPTVLDSVVMEIPYYSTVKSVEEVQVDGKTERRTTYQLDSIYGVEGSKFKLSVYQSNYYLRNLDPNESLGETQLFYTDMDAEIDNNKIPVLLNDLATSDPRNTDGHENSQFYFDKREHKTITYEEDGTTEIKTRSKPSMRLHLNKDVFDAAILNAPSGQLANNNVFKNYFRGIYFKTESLGNPGNMATLNFKDGKITLYYNEDVKKTDSEGVVTYERTNKTYALNLNGNTVSLLNNYNENTDYLNATINNNQEATQLFLKGGQGSISVIDIFGPDADNNGIADEIEVIKANGWMINEASLTFYVDKPAMSDTRSIEPNRIFLYDLTNKKALVDYNLDFSNSGAYPKLNKPTFGGILEKEDVEGGRGIRYKIRITNHVRNLIKKDSTNVRLGLSVTENINNVGFSKLKVGNTTTNSAPSMSVMSPLGTILYGSSPLVPDEKRLKLEIYYTKPN
ncbi:DUF4270 domain-containing protein [Flavobacterium sp. RSB2_4_14]|uniref:DUF4270 domain-containing protein n=1 Tax=Flavobacterium sp. RSB2_4_14 TaxID=3447665 RepID=UPI003F3E30DB